MPRLASPAVGRLLPWALAAGIVLIAGALRYPTLFEPRWYGDEGIFAAIAGDIRSGDTLYADSWDNKPPLIFFTYAAVQHVFGAGVLPLHAAASAVVIATLIVTMLIAGLVATPSRAPVAGLLFALLMATPILEANLALTETFMMLPSALGVLLFLHATRAGRALSPAHALAAGALFGVAAGYKQVAGFDLAAVATIVWFTQERRTRGVAWLAGGFALPQAALAAYFIAAGAYSEYWYAVAGSLPLYAEIGPELSPFTRFAGLLPPLLAVAWLRERQRRGERIDARDLPFVWLAFAIAGATSSAFGFPHYLQQAAAPAAVAIAASRAWWSLGPVRVRALAGVTALLCAALVTGQFSMAFEERRQLDPVDYYRTFVSYRWGTMSDRDYRYFFDGKVEAVDDIAAAVEDDRAGATLFAWSELPWVYEAADMRNPTRYYTSFLGELVPGAKRDVLDGLAADPPVYVVVSDGAYAPFMELERFVAERYELVRAQGDWRLYRLQDTPGRLTPAAAGDHAVTGSRTPR